jgi:16S rRNA (guanine527-N7)-methyltransferase
MSAELSQILDGAQISEAVMSQLEALVSLVTKWNPSINVVAKSTVNDIWSRHILDSAQLFRLAPESTKSWADLGSGGGFPGLVVAILAADLRKGLKVTLVESDKRKCVFLTEAARTLGLDLTVIAARIEDIPPLCADVVSARALAPLPALCSMAIRHLSPDGICIFPKGVKADVEIDLARNDWQFDLNSIKSATDGGASLLVMKGLQRA